MTLNRKTGRKHGAGTLVGPGMREIAEDFRQRNAALEQERVANQLRIQKNKERAAAIRRGK